MKCTRTLYLFGKFHILRKVMDKLLFSPSPPEPLIYKWYKANKVFVKCNMISLLYTGNPITSILANSEDPDEMQHNAAFHQGLHCLKR